jgi:hypothetical protein
MRPTNRVLHFPGHSIERLPSAQISLPVSEQRRALHKPSLCNLFPDNLIMKTLFTVSVSSLRFRFILFTGSCPERLFPPKRPAAAHRGPRQDAALLQCGWEEEPEGAGALSGRHARVQGRVHGGRSKSCRCGEAKMVLRGRPRVRACRKGEGLNRIALSFLPNSRDT